MDRSNNLPVHTDGTEVQDGGGAEHHIHGHQSVTDGGAQSPHSSQELKTQHLKLTVPSMNIDPPGPAEHLTDLRVDIERQHEHGQQQVGHRKADNEVVGGGLQ